MIRSIQQEGSALVTALLLIFAIGIMGATVVSMTSTDLKISGNQRYNTEALFAAEAGLTEAIHRVALTNPTNLVVGGQTVNAAISDAKPYDPNWKTYIQLKSPPAQPVKSGSVYTTGTLQNLSGDYLDYSRASGTNEVLLIEHQWSDRDGDGVRDADEIVRYDPTQVPALNFTSGSPVEVVTVTARSGNAVRTLQAEVTRMSILARTYGALFSNRPIRVTGTPSFCGWNHRVTTPYGTKPLGCFAYHEASGALPGIASTGDAVDQGKKGADVWGSPVKVDTSPANPWYTLAEVLGISDTQLDGILANADITDEKVTLLDGITYLTGDVHLNSGATGRGLLYVTGDAVVNSLSYTGLIYIEGNLTLNGNCRILGSMVVNGRTDYGFSAGDAVVLYCQQALEDAIASQLPLVVLSWRDM